MLYVVFFLVGMFFLYYAALALILLIGCAVSDSFAKKHRDSEYLKRLRGDKEREDPEAMRQKALDEGYVNAHWTPRAGTNGEHQLDPLFCKDCPPLHYMLLIPYRNSNNIELLKRASLEIGKMKQEGLGDPSRRAIIEMMNEMNSWPAEYWIQFETDVAKLIREADWTGGNIAKWFWDHAKEELMHREELSHAS